MQRIAPHTVFLTALPMSVPLCLGMTAAAAQEQESFETLLERVEKVEAEQARDRQTIEDLEAALRVANGETLPVAPHGRVMFPWLERDSGFTLGTSDGDFTLRMHGLVAGRYEVNERRKDESGSGDTDQGFETTAARVNFQGDVYDDYGYWMRFNADSFGDPFIDVILGMYYLDEDTTLAFGQYPSLLTRDQGLPLEAIQAIDSSPTNYTFDPFGFKGVIIGHHTPEFVLRGLIHDGYHSTNNSAFDASSAEWGVGGQALWMAVGDEEDWSRFDNFTSRPGEDFAWLLNGSFVLQEGGEYEDDDGRKSELSHLLMGESSLEGDGWNLYQALYYRHSEETYDASEADDFGFVIQGGKWATEHIEAYSRYDMTIPDGDRELTDGDFKTITVGAGYYPIPESDNIKYAAEFMYMFDDVDGSIVEPNDFSSVRESPAGDQWVFRIQLLLRW